MRRLFARVLSALCLLGSLTGCIIIADPSAPSTKMVTQTVTATPPPSTVTAPPVTVTQTVVAPTVTVAAAATPTPTPVQTPTQKPSQSTPLSTPPSAISKTTVQPSPSASPTSEPIAIVMARNPQAAPILIRNYNWAYRGNQYTCQLYLPQDLYDFYRSLPRDAAEKPQNAEIWTSSRHDFECKTRQNGGYRPDF